MTKYILEALLQVVVIVPLAYFFLKEKNRLNLQRIGWVALSYVLYQVALVLPKLHPNFDFVKSRWNWDGKIWGIGCCVLLYFGLRKYFRTNDFFTWRQDQKNFKPALMVATAVVVLSAVVWFLLGSSDFDAETLAFQFLLPGLDEEMLFRGILLGLLMSSLKDKISFLGTPSVLLTAVLFGLMHGLTFKSSYKVDFNAIYFLQTAFAGYLWGWVTVKSRSLLLAIASHNLGNFLGTLLMMVK